MFNFSCLYFSSIFWASLFLCSSVNLIFSSIKDNCVFNSWSCFSLSVVSTLWTLGSFCPQVGQISVMLFNLLISSFSEFISATILYFCSCKLSKVAWCSCFIWFVSKSCLFVIPKFCWFNSSSWSLFIWSWEFNWFTSSFNWFIFILMLFISSIFGATSDYNWFSNWGSCLL